MKILINELRQIQEKEGYLSEETIVRLAEEYGVSKARLYGIISFYSRFYTEEMGRYMIRVCKSVSCGINGSDAIINKIHEMLQIKTGETTEDKMFSFEVIECLGHCGEGPVMTVNDKVYSKVTPEYVEEIIEDYQREGDLTC